MMFTVRMDRLHRLGRFASDRKGSTAIAMAILTPFMIAGLAFGTEVGYWELTKRRLQNAADTAAFAAATQKRLGLDQSDFEDAALAVANDSGFTLAVEGQPNPDATGALVVESPPTRGGYIGDDDAIMVSVDTTVPRRFTKLFLSNDVSITAFATAEVQNPRPACVLSLHPTASGAITVSGSTQVNLTGCDLAANSVSNDAIVKSSTGSTLTADCLSTVGGTAIDSSTSGVSLSDCPEPIENAPVTLDPYRDRPEPTVPATCATGGEQNDFFSQPTKTESPLPSVGSPTNNNLGKSYCLGSGNTHVQGVTNLSPGIYVFRGPGTLSVNAGATLRGDDVVLYLTDGADIDINGNANIDLAAPTPATQPSPSPLEPYYGLVIYFDRDDTTNSEINGGSNFSLVGAVYGANTNITFNGNTAGSGPGECTQVIGARVTFSGNSSFDTDCSNSGTSAIVTAQSISLVE